jgi:hypothetical protein
MARTKAEDRSQPVGPRRQLLERVLSSRHFQHAQMQSAVLRYLVERSHNSAAPPKEYDIAVNAMQRQQSFDPKYDPVVRVTVSSIRKRLRMYFLQEGRWERFHLAIPKGAYHVLFLDAATDRSQADAEQPYPDRSLELFWQPHLASDAGNVLVYTEPLFFRDAKGHYYRDPDVNDLHAAERFLKTRAAEVPFGPLRLSVGCLWTGEVHCMLAVLRLFHSLGAALEIRNPRACSWLELKQTSLVLLGNARTNSILKALDGDTPFVLTSRQIELQNPGRAGKTVYRDSRFIDGNMDRMTAYALITRRPSPTGGGVVTIVAANHCRGIEGAGYFLSQESKVRGVLDTIGAPGEALPRRFQLVLRVDTIDTTRVVVNSECVAWRVFDRPTVVAAVVRAPQRPRRKRAAAPSDAA